MAAPTRPDRKVSSICESNRRAATHGDLLQLAAREKPELLAIRRKKGFDRSLGARNGLGVQTFHHPQIQLLGAALAGDICEMRAVGRERERRARSAGSCSPANCWPGGSVIVKRVTGRGAGGSVGFRLQAASPVTPAAARTARPTKNRPPPATCGGTSDRCAHDGAREPPESRCSRRPHPAGATFCPFANSVAQSAHGRRSRRR